MSSSTLQWMAGQSAFSPSTFWCQWHAISPVAILQMRRLPVASSPSCMRSHVSRKVPLGESESACTCGRDVEKTSAPPTALMTRTHDASTAARKLPSALYVAKASVGCVLTPASAATAPPLTVSAFASGLPRTKSETDVATGSAVGGMGPVERTWSALLPCLTGRSAWRPSSFD